MSNLPENITMPRGGAREGAGRKSSGVETVAIAIRIPKKTYAKLRKKSGKELHAKLKDAVISMA